MDTQAMMAEMREILDGGSRPVPPISEAKDPADEALSLFETSDKLKNLLSKEVNSVASEWSKAAGEIRRAKRWGGASIAAVDYLEDNKPPMQALERLDKRLHAIMEHIRSVRSQARRGGGGAVRGYEDLGAPDLDLLGEDLLADDVGLFAEAYADIGSDAPYVGHDAETEVEEAVTFGSPKKGAHHKDKSGDPPVITKVRKIARESQAAKIDGVMVDMSTANLVARIYDALSGANKKKFASMSIDKMGQLAWKLSSK